MKVQLLAAALGIFTLSNDVFAQGVKKDSIAALEYQKESLALSKSVNDRKLELAKLENEYQEKSKQVTEAAEKARKSALENKDAAARLTNNAQDKKLANEAKAAARKAEREAKSARKESDNQEKLVAKITSLQKQIAEEEAKLGGVATAAPANAALSGGQEAVSGTRGVRESGQVAPASTSKPVGEVTSQTMGAQSAPLQIDNPIPVGQTTDSQVRTITEKVIESTYKNYPQQPGQPSIIINNIIIPSDYDRPEQPKRSEPEHRAVQSETPSDYEEYLAWKRQKNEYKGYNYEPREQAASVDRGRDAEGKMTFKERFGERPARKSGLWVIPLVGVHASDFKADFSNDEAKGRTGWNAGLDFRMHTRRFFVQPGVHYFNSSLKMTDKDDLSTAPLLDGPRIHSLKVPVMLGLYLTKANKGFFKFNVKGGATGNYVIAVDKDSQRKFDKDNIEEYSYGLAAGVGLEFGLITLDLSHEWGMSPFLKNTDAKNNVLRATLGVKL